MPRREHIAIVGAGSLGWALALALHRAGYKVAEIIVRNKSSSEATAKPLARRIGAEVKILRNAHLEADAVWICVPDDAIAAVARELAARGRWKKKIVLHSSGARSSDELQPLKKRGAQVGSAHPMMTFVRGAEARWKGIAMAVEGDAAAVALARRVARDLKMNAFGISAANKVLYHAVGSFCSPLLISLLDQAKEVARAAKIPQAMRARITRPILLKTLENYFAKGAAEAFSGPIQRGDITTVRKHLEQLKKVKGAREIYAALLAHALQSLPVKNRKELRNLLRAR